MYLYTTNLTFLYLFFALIVLHDGLTHSLCRNKGGQVPKECTTLENVVLLEFFRESGASVATFEKFLARLKSIPNWNPSNVADSVYMLHKLENEIIAPYKLVLWIEPFLCPPPHLSSPPTFFPLHILFCPPFSYTYSLFHHFLSPPPLSPFLSSN